MTERATASSPKRIFLCTDLSDGSRSAYAAGAELARRFGAELLLVSQTEMPVPYGAWTAPGAGELFFAQDRHDEACLDLEQRLASLAREDALLAGAGARPFVVREGGIEAFVDAIHAERADLVILATHGRKGFRRLVLGSFAERIVQLSPSAVLVCRVEEDRPAPSAFSPRSILVPCDLSDSSAEVLEAAALWARTFGARVRLLHVIDWPPGGMPASGETLYGSEEYLKWMRQKADHALAESIQTVLAGLDAEPIVAEGHPVIEIAAAAERLAADLIVMGSHGLTGMRHFVIGSVAERTVRRAPCPVLVVRQPRVDPAKTISPAAAAKDAVNDA